MDYRELVKSAISTSRINILRTSLTMLGIIIGIASVILIASIGQSSVKFISNELSSFGTNYFQVAPGKNALSAVTGGSGKPLTVKDAEAIENAGIANIESVAPFGYISRQVSANDEKTTVFVYGLTSEALSLLKPEIVYGEFISDGDKSNRVAVVGIDTAEELFGEDTNPVGEFIKIGDIKFRVIGVTKAGGNLFGSFFNSSVNIPLDVMHKDLTGDEKLWEIDISVYNTDQLNQTMEDVTVLLREERKINPGEDDDFNLASFQESLDIVNTITSLLTLLIAGVSAISLVVGGVGVMNIMLVSVTERTKEIGLLKAIGAKRRDILIQFLIESVVMTVSGGIIGIIIGISGAFIISLVVGIPFVISIPWILIAVIVSAFVGVGFGIYPARRAAKLSPIDALRYE